jgi:hypothetical protein
MTIQMTIATIHARTFDVLLFMAIPTRFQCVARQHEFDRTAPHLRFQLMHREEFFLP